MNIKVLLPLIFVFSVTVLADEKAKTDPKIVPLNVPSPFFVAGHGDPLSPEQIRAQMKKSVAMQNEMMRARLKSFSNPEMAKSFAQFSRAYYEALVESGFTKKEALQIVVSVGIPNFR